MKDDIVALVVGFCGSMGKRRIRCLKRFSDRQIKIYGDDIHPNRKSIAETLGIELLDNQGLIPDVVIVSTPPDKHIDIIKKYLRMGSSVFCEASVVPEDRHHYKEINEICKQTGSKFFPSATIQFKNIVKKISKAIREGEIGQPIFYDYKMAQNLHQWHPHQSIHDFYVSVPATGAGREMCAFELAWLSSIFGHDIDVMSSCVKSISEIGVSTGIDDLYTFVVNHSSAEGKPGVLGTSSIDVFSHKIYRFLRVAGTEGNIEFDWISNQATIFNKSGEVVKTLSEDQVKVHPGYTQFSAEGMYDNEINNFLDSVLNGGEPECDMQKDFSILNAVEKIEKISLK
jgi:predicted dehydrogenase